MGGSELAMNVSPLATLDTLLKEGAFESVQLLADIIISTYQEKGHPWGGRFFALAGQACLAMRDDDRAKMFLSRAAHEYGRLGEQDKQSAAKYEIARVHFFQGNWNEGIMEIEGIPSKYRTTGTQLLLAKFYERLSCNRAAKATYADAVRGQPLAVEAVLSLASLNSAVEYNDRYDELCKQSITKIPPSLTGAMATIWNAKCSLLSADFEAKANAARMCWERVDSLSKNIEFLNTTFQLSMWMRNWTQAARTARMIEAVDPALSSQRQESSLAWAMIETGHLEEAYVWAIKPMAAEQSSESGRHQNKMAGMWVALAEIHRRRGSVAIAEQLLVNAADADGEDLASYHLSYGLVQVSKHKFSSAVLSLRQARRLGEGTFWAAFALYHMCDAMAKAERPQDAARYAEELVVMQPLPVSLLMAACAMSRIGNANRALHYLEQSLRACPSESLKEVVNGQKPSYESRFNVWGGTELRRLMRELLHNGDEKLIEMLKKRINMQRLKADVQATGSGAGQTHTPLALNASKANDIVANLFSA